MHYSVGLDIGIGSVGWAVLQNDVNGEPVKIIALGSRIFDKAEQPKTGASLALPRREARSARRRLRRHRHRLERIKYLLECSGIMSLAEIKKLYENPHFENNVYKLRTEGLDRVLNREEWVRVLIHLAQRRGYKSNSTAEAVGDKESGKVKQAIASNTELMNKKGYRTVGEMMYKDERFKYIQPDGTILLKTRNDPDYYIFTIERSAIVDEIKLLFKKQREYGSQWADEKIEKAYLDIFESQRSFDQGPGGNSPYGGNQIEKMVGVCTFEDEPRAVKASYTFEYFKLLSDVNKIRLVRYGEKGELLTPDQREALINLALKSQSITYERIRKELGIGEEYYFNTLYYGDKSREEQEKAKWPQMQSYHKIRLALDKAGKDSIKSLSHEQLDEIGRILTLYKSDEKRIVEFGKAGIPTQFNKCLLEISFSKVGNLSLTALKKIIPYLEDGENYDKACAAVYGDHRRPSSVKRKQFLSMNDVEPFTNPVVRRAIAQSIKVINAIVRQYGALDVIRIELAREMSKNFDERNNIKKHQEENRARNERIKEQIEEIKKERATGQDIVKFRLWQEQGEICIYSGKHLDISRLFEPGYVDIDHIIPYSKCFDDSYANKVLVLAEENRQKGNRLPYDYLSGDQRRWQEFETRVGVLIRDHKKRAKLLKKKFTEEESSAFIQRNLIDTQYISRQLSQLISENLLFAESKYSKRPVQTVNGAITAQIRKRLGIEKLRENGDLHHAADAAVIATISPGMIQKLTEYSKNMERIKATGKGYLDTETGELLTREEYNLKYSPKFPPPWESFAKELEMRLSSNPQEMIDVYGYPNYDSDEEVRPVFVSRKPNHKITGSAHMDTIRSAKKPGYTITKTPLSELKLTNGEIEGYYNPASDRLLYESLKARLMEFGGDGKKAFEEPFYKPKSDGTQGPLVKKVKIYDKSTVNVAVNNGVAANGAMVRIDVFYIEDDGYYMVPIYVSDTIKPTLPDKAVVANKPYEEWKEMRPEDFVFSLYPGDLLHIESKKGIKFSLSKGAAGEKQIIRNECFCYYTKACISTAAITITTHDRRYEQASQGIKTLQKLEKYQVDVLGNIYKVKTPEKRLSFTKGNKHGVS